MAKRWTMIFGVAPLLCVAAAPSPIIGFDGVAPVRVGMSLAQAKQLLHGKFSIQPPSEDDPNGCGYLIANSRQGDVGYMFDKGRIRRADVENSPKSPIRTAAGIGVGSSVADIRRAYGERARSHPNAYSAPEPDFEIKSPDGKAAIIFETIEGRVALIRAGQLPWAEFIEGCS